MQKYDKGMKKNFYMKYNLNRKILQIYMEDERILINKLMDELVTLDYSTHNDNYIIKMLQDIGLKRLNWARVLCHSSIENMIKNPTDGKTFPSKSFVYKPCDEMDLFIKLCDNFYLPIIFLKSNNTHPVYNKKIIMDYLYVFTSKTTDKSVLYLGKDILTKLQEKIINQYTKRIRNEINNLNMNLLKIDENKRGLKVRSKIELYHSGERLDSINYFTHPNRDEGLKNVIQYIFKKFEGIRIKKEFEKQRNALEEMVALEEMDINNI